MTKRNNAISVLRVVSMLAIVLLHVFSYFNINKLGILNIFIYVFFIISGYLYSNRSIADKKQFIILRIKKILVPLWIWSFFLSTIILLKGNSKLAFSSFLVSLFNQHGLDYFFFGRNILDKFQIEGLIHCWFITCIFFCYVLLAFVKNSKVEYFINKNKLLFLFVSILFQILLSLLFNVQIAGVLAFFIGYFCFNNNVNGKDVIYSLFFSFIFLIIRLISHNYIDGSVLYDQIVQPYFNIIFSILIFTFTLYVYNKNNLKIVNILNNITNSKIFLWLENNSFYVYIVHYSFLKYPFSVSNLFDSSFFQFIAFIIFTFISSLLLNIISNINLNNRKSNII